MRSLTRTCFWRENKGFAFITQPPFDGDDVDTVVTRMLIQPNQIAALDSLNLSDFITENRHNFFERFKISTNFLKKHPSQWETDRQDKEAREFLGQFKAVNDNAERGVKLMDDFNKKITQDEETKQYLVLTDCFGISKKVPKLL